MDIFAKSEGERLLCALLRISPLSETELQFLLAYYDWGPGAEKGISIRDFSILYGLNEGMTLLRVEFLREQMEMFFRSLGFTKGDL